MPTLAHGLHFDDLYIDAHLMRVDDAFRRMLADADAALAARLDAARADPDSLARLAESQLLIGVAPHLEDFLAVLFGIESDVRALESRHHALAPLFAVRRQFVQRKAVNAHKGAAAEALDGPALRAALEARLGAFDDIAFAGAVLAWQQDEAANAEPLQLALQYAAWATQSAAGKAAHKGSVLFRVPRKLDFVNLVPLATATRNEVSTVETPPGHPVSYTHLRAHETGRNLVC